MTTAIIKCNNCGNIMVVNTKELWKLTTCTKCTSTNIVNMEDEFSLSEIGETVNDKKNSF